MDCDDNKAFLCANLANTCEGNASRRRNKMAKQKNKRNNYYRLTIMTKAHFQHTFGEIIVGL